MGHKYEDYQGQLVDLCKSRKVDGATVSTRFNILDKLSPVEERNDVPFITTFAPYSVYLATILEGKESVECNITLEDFFDIKAKTATVNDLVYRAQLGLVNVPKEEPVQETGKDDKGEISAAFVTALSMGEFKGRTPGEIILSATDRPAAVEALKKHADFCSRNLTRYPSNQKYIDAVNAAIDLYDLELLEEEQKLAKTQNGSRQEPTAAFEYVIHEPVDKYFQKKVQKFDGEDYTKCYKYRVSARPGNNYPYHIEIINYYAPIGHTQSGLTPIQTAKKRGEIRKSFDFTMSQWTMLVEDLTLNTESCHRLFYPEARRLDESYSFRNQAQ